MLRRSRSDSCNKCVALSKILGTKLGAGTFVGYAHSVDKVNIIQSAAVIDPRARKATRLHNSPLNFIDLLLSDPFNLFNLTNIILRSNLMRIA